MKAAWMHTSNSTIAKRQSTVGQSSSLVILPLLFLTIAPVSCGPESQFRFGWDQPRVAQPAGSSSHGTSPFPVVDSFDNADQPAQDASSTGVDKRVQDFVTRVTDDRDRKDRITPSQSPNPATQPAANQPIIVAMRPVEAASTRPAESGGSDVQASPEPVANRLLQPLPEPSRARVELIDVRPAATPTTMPSPGEPAAPANQPVQQLSVAQPTDLGAILSGLEEALKGRPQQLDDQFRLRLLYLATDQDQKALGPIASADPVQGGLVTALFEVMTATKAAIRQPTSSPAPALMAADELRRLLGQQSPVIIPKIALVKRVNSFGDYEAVSPPKFPAGEPIHVFLYTEVANFRSEPTPDGRLRTLLAERVEIFDAAGKVIWQQSAEGIEDKVLSPRHDFFIPLEVRLPADTAAGEYVLKVSIEDKLGATTDQQRMALTIE